MDQQRDQDAHGNPEERTVEALVIRYLRHTL